MAMVEIRFTALAAHVRTARLVAVAVARRARVSDEVLDEVRLAVGEACSRAVALHRRHAPTEPIVMRLTDGATTFRVEVCDSGPADAAMPRGDAVGVDVDPERWDRDGAAADALPPGFGLAVIAGLVDHVDVVPALPTGTRVTMSWPIPVIEQPVAGAGGARR